jgi:4-amino-4-deoxy-L-arabinose transferase-like glycosyltransferase
VVIGPAQGAARVSAIVIRTLTTRPLEPPVHGDPGEAVGPPGRSGVVGRRISQGVLLVGTAVLYLWNLSASGWANAFYSAAAQAGGENWTAWFFGSSDAANSITVDKTPAALWITGLSVRVFGLSSWSILVPQALMGVATVGLLYATVRRVSGHGAGLLAGAVLALTPVATLMFRFNNPDALLVLLLVAAVWASMRGLENGRTRWLVLAGVFIGVGFLAKMLQAFLIVPALAALWLVASPTTIRHRVRDLLLAGVVVVVSAGWWVLIAELWPVSSRPYIGGSQNNSVLELVFGYNGFGRLTGDETGSVGGSAGGGWGRTGLTRLFSSEMAPEAGWLIPAALILLVGLVWVTGRAPRTDRLRAATIAWGGWLLVTGLVFSFMAGIFHSYYLVAIAPATAALVGMGATELWRRRELGGARALLAASVAVTAIWSFMILADDASWQPWLRWAVLGVCLVASAALLGLTRLPRLLAVGVATAAVLASLGGTAAYSVATAATAHTGAIPSSGPAGSGMRGSGGPGGAMRAAPPAGFVGTAPGGAGTGAAAGGTGTSATPGGTGTPPIGTGGTGTRGTGTFPQAGTTPGGGFGGRGGMGGAGSLLNSAAPSAAVTALLQQDAGAYTWVAAAVGSNSAAGYQLAAGAPVMAVGGFNGTDPAPTLEEFQADVAQGKIHWFVDGAGSDRGGSDTGGSDAAARIAAWVRQTFTATAVDGTTLYDLSTGATA